MKITIILTLLICFSVNSETNINVKNYNSYDEIEHDYFFGEEKFNNALMMRWIRDTGAGMALVEAVKRFEREYGRLTQDYRDMFERVHRETQEQRERDNQRRNEGDHNNGSGGFLDNINNDARGGVGV